MKKLKPEFPEKQIRSYLDQVYPIDPKTAEVDLDDHFGRIDNVQQLRKYLNEATAAAEMRGMWKDAFTGPLITVIVAMVTVGAAFIAPQVQIGDKFSVGFYEISYLVIVLGGSAWGISKAAADARRRIANLLIKEAIERRLAKLE